MSALPLTSKSFVPTNFKISGDDWAIRSKPMTSRNFRSVSVTALTTPELLKARQESFPALLLQSPKSPPGLVLKLFKLVVPSLIEKYPGVVPEKSRTPGEE